VKQAIERTQRELRQRQADVGGIQADCKRWVAKKQSDE
jgi:hypothetical protein